MYFQKNTLMELSFPDQRQTKNCIFTITTTTMTSLLPCLVFCRKATFVQPAIKVTIIRNYTNVIIHVIAVVTFTIPKKVVQFIALTATAILKENIAFRCTKKSKITDILLVSYTINVNSATRPSTSRHSTEHKCGERYCNTCKDYYSEDHQCYMQTVDVEMENSKRKHMKKDELKFIFFDFECMQDDVLQCEGGYLPDEFKQGGHWM